MLESYHDGLAAQAGVFDDGYDAYELQVFCGSQRVKLSKWPWLLTACCVVNREFVFLAVIAFSPGERSV